MFTDAGDISRPLLYAVSGDAATCAGTAGSVGEIRTTISDGMWCTASRAAYAMRTSLARVANFPIFGGDSLATREGGSAISIGVMCAL